MSAFGGFPCQCDMAEMSGREWGLFETPCGQHCGCRELTKAMLLQGCMKSGQVLTDRRYKWFEPEYWRFGDPASAEGQINYMRHASGQVCPNTKFGHKI